MAGHAVVHSNHVYDGKKSGGPTVGSTWTYYDTSGGGVCEYVSTDYFGQYTIVGVLTEKTGGVRYAPEYVLAGSDPLAEGDG